MSHNLAHQIPEAPKAVTRSVVDHGRTRAVQASDGSRILGTYDRALRQAIATALDAISAKGIAVDAALLSPGDLPSAEVTLDRMAQAPDGSRAAGAWNVGKTIKVIQRKPDAKGKPRNPLYQRTIRLDGEGSLRWYTATEIGNGRPTEPKGIDGAMGLYLAAVESVLTARMFRDALSVALRIYPAARKAGCSAALDRALGPCRPLAGSANDSADMAPPVDPTVDGDSTVDAASNG